MYGNRFQDENQYPYRSDRSQGRESRHNYNPQETEGGYGLGGDASGQGSFEQDPSRYGQRSYEGGATRYGQQHNDQSGGYANPRGRQGQQGGFSESGYGGTSQGSYGAQQYGYGAGGQQQYGGYGSEQSQPGYRPQGGPMGYGDQMRGRGGSYGSPAGGYADRYGSFQQGNYPDSGSVYGDRSEQQRYSGQQGYGQPGMGNAWGGSGSGGSGMGRSGMGMQQGGRAMRSGKSPKGYSRSDTRIQEDVNDRLMEAWDLDPSDIEVKVKDGEVTLTGSVDSRNDKMQAEDLADSVLGVKEVVNQLRVKRNKSDQSSRSGGGSETEQKLGSGPGYGASSSSSSGSNSGSESRRTGSHAGSSSR